MTPYWILIFSWVGVASPQFIKNDPGIQYLVDTREASNRYSPLPYRSFLNYPIMRTAYPMTNIDHETMKPIFPQQISQIDDRKRKEYKEQSNDVTEGSNSISTARAFYENRAGPYLIGIAAASENSTDVLEPLEKRSFSPWGGKRSDPENEWTWKRSLNVREPTMPKRVRFSPWGGKRSGQMVYKGDNKKPKMIFAPYVPDLTRIISNYPPGNKYNVAGVYFTPYDEKRIPIRVLRLDNIDEIKTREAHLKTFLDTLPKLFRPGQTYANVFLKKDGKRKFKFSAWGGKRSPPIIGPIWSPASQKIKDKTLDSIVLIRNDSKGLATT